MSDCVEFQGYLDRNGYGRINRKGQSPYAHRAEWETVHGPIPKDLVVMHTCDNPACINIQHLTLGSQADNIEDRQAKERQARGLSNARCKMNPEMIAEATMSDESSRVVAARLGVSHTAVLEARRRKTYLSNSATVGHG